LKERTVSATSTYLPLHAGELFGHVEGLGEEALDLAGAGDGQAVLFGQFVHAQNRDDVLQFLVALQDLLHAAGDLVVLFADDLGGENGGGGGERGPRRDRCPARRWAGQLGGGVQVREGRGGRRVGVVVGGHVHGLDRGDRTVLGGGDAFLQFAHVGAEGGLVTHGGGDAAEQRGHFGAGLGEAEDVVDEQQHVLAHLVAEVCSAMVRAERATRARAPGGSFIWPNTIAVLSMTPDSRISR
jgi:hypothetical protein